MHVLLKHSFDVGGLLRRGARLQNLEYGDNRATHFSRFPRKVRGTNSPELYSLLHSLMSRDVKISGSNPTAEDLE